MVHVLSTFKRWQQALSARLDRVDRIPAHHLQPTAGHDPERCCLLIRHVGRDIETTLVCYCGSHTLPSLSPALSREGP